VHSERVEPCPPTDGIQAQQVPTCQIVLGDRPVGITLKRAISSLSTWKKIRLAWSLLTSKEKITSVAGVLRCRSSFSFSFKE
jgi:pheromone shutdown protein TraB